MAADDMPPQGDATQRGFNYGWAIVAVMFLAQMLAVGITSYGFALLVKPIAAEYGLPRADVNLGLMLLLVGMGLSSPFIGRALDKLPGRIVIAAGALIFGLGAGAIALTTSLWGMAAATILLLAVGAATLGPLAAATLTSRWFDKGRGRALGIVSVATSAGGLVVLPLMAVLVEQFGWRIALGSLGATVTVLIGALGLLVIREPQADRVTSRRAQPGDVATMHKHWTSGELLRTRDFWLIIGSVGILFAVDQALLASLIAYGTDRGFSLSAAAMLISAISGSAIVGKLIVGALSDRIDLRWLLLALAVLTEIYLALLLLAPSYTILLAGSLIVGAAVGGTSPLWASFIALRFGLPSYGAVMGLMIPLQMPLVLIALRYIGHTYDVAGSYYPAFVTFAVVVVIAALLILPVRLRARPAGVMSPASQPS